MNKVTKYTRAARKGKFIYCPHCGAEARVFHFSWCAITCNSCNQMVDKLEWFVDNPKIPRPDNRMKYTLIFDRSYSDFVHKFNENYLAQHGYFLDEVDSSGSRSVWTYTPIGSTDYDDAEDLPQWVFDDFRDWLKMRHRMTPDQFSIFRRMPDPGLGIMLPEDFEMLNKGQLPDGCIPLSVT